MNAASGAPLWRGGGGEGLLREEMQVTQDLLAPGVFALAAGILLDASRGAPDAQGMPAGGLCAGLVRGPAEPARHTFRIRLRPTDDVDQGA